MCTSWRSILHVFDASSMIYAWDNYPLGQFPGVWEWLAVQVEARRLCLSRVAFDEVQVKTADCCFWLKSHTIELVEVDNQVALEALRIKKLIGVVGDQYHPKGVGENDLFIIATARTLGCVLVSDEKRQLKDPDVSSKRKIPAVCALPQVAVDCINFLDYLKASGEVFR